MSNFSLMFFLLLVKKKNHSSQVSTQTCDKNSPQKFLLYCIFMFYPQNVKMDKENIKGCGYTCINLEMVFMSCTSKPLEVFNGFHHVKKTKDLFL